jgi:hypothetical protein
MNAGVTGYVISEETDWMILAHNSYLGFHTDPTKRFHAEAVPVG